MKKKLILLTLTGLCFTAPVMANQSSHWGYSGGNGPQHWSDLNADYSVCSSGKNQSPVNLTGFIDANLSPIKFNYLSGGNQILNNGHTIQVNYKSGSSINIEGHSYDLKQFHFHAPSENTINGKSYPMEAHLVHADKDGHLAVVSLMFEEGSENNTLQNAWRKMPTKKNIKILLNKNINAESLLPGNKNYYRFNGSLTTPPCSEGVTWAVIKESVSASKEQIEKFKHAMHHANNRPLQALNARTVLQ